MLSEVVGHDLDQVSREEHPRLCSVDADVAEDGLELRGDELRRHLVHSGHTRGVLRRQRDDRAHSVTAGGRERLQVGLDPGAAAGVRAGNGKTTWNRHVSLPSPVRTGSGSTGVISAAFSGTPVERG
jgi:hypothetical protein